MSNTALGAALTIDDSVLEQIRKAEEKVKRLEETTRTSADKIVKSFRNAGDVGIQYFIEKLKLAQTELGKINVPKIDFGQSINFRQVSQQATLLAESVAKASVAINQYYSSTQKSNRKTTISTEEERKAYIQKYEMYKKMFDQIERNEKRAIKAAENEAKAQEQAAQRIIAAARRQYAEQAKLYQQQNLKQNTTYQGALSFAESANTINRRTKAIQYLTQARAQLSTTDANYTQKLKALNDAIKRMNTENEKAVQGTRNLAKQHSNLMNTSDQLMRKLALIFSVSQIQGYVNKLIQVRGEFELQNTALASILQNKDQADKLFGQITELAVKSPFTVKELTTYTKSLAAYQFQYEELYDTTKRLADVASGLGVDMQRLILAVGQVKAAGYLRGTETRQFTEAGFNILGELAKYYSELEGRIVSVGEVQERQFKRMIAFQDVEEVFRRVTDAGGMFYQMQEKQAETLAGQMSNLKDSIDLMFNSIGKANDGTLKDMVALVRSFIENWQEVVFVLEPAVAALGAWKALTLLASIGNKKFALSLYAIATNAKTATASISLMTRATTMLAAVGRGLMSVFAIAIPVALIAGVMELYRVTTKASREANELKKALDGISNEGFVRASELISNFKVLAEKAVEAADGSKEQQAALEELQRTYKDILPERELEIDKLRELKGEYDNVTTAIYSKIEAQIKEKQIQEVSNTYGTAASEAMDALAKRLTDYNISLSTAKTITNEFKKMLEQGMIKDANQAKTELENLIRLFSGQYASLGGKNIWQRLGWTTGVDAIDEIDDAFNAFTRFNDEVKRLEGEPITPFRIGGGTEMYQSLKEELENIAKFKEDWEKQNKDKFKFKVEFNEESKNALIAEYQKFIADLNNRISSGQIKQGDILSANLIIEEAQKAIEKLDVSPQIAQVNDLRVEFSKLYNIDFEKFNFTKMLEGQGFNDFIKRLDEGIQGYQEIIDVFDEAAKQGIEVPAMQQWALLQGKTIEEIRAFVPVLKEYRKELALVKSEENKKGGRDNTEQIFKQRLEFFERANKEYEKLLKNYSEEEAKAKVIKSMQDEAIQRGVGGIFMSAEFDDQGTLDSLNRVKAMYKSLSEDMRIEFAKAFGGIELDMDVEIRQDRIKTIQDQFSDLFGNYELSLELDKLGLDKDIASDLFGVEIFDLTELRKRAEVYKDELQNILGKEGVSAWDAINKQITDAETKELQERLKNYAKYLKKSVSERVAIEMEAQKKIAEVRATEEFSPEQQETITQKIKLETQQELDKLSWEEFKGTDTYLQLFEDLEYMSTSAINKMLSELTRLRESLKNLPPEALKEITRQMEKLENIKIQRNPFKYLLSDDVKEASMAWQEMGNILNEISSAATDIASSLENVFGTMSDKTSDIVSSFSEIASGVGNTATGVGRILAGDVIGGGLQALQGLASTIGSIFAIGDKKKEREIQKKIEQVEKLQKAYEKLEEAIDNAYSIDTLEESNRLAQENIEQTIAHYEQMIAAEKDKKKVDEKDIKEWEDAIEDLREEQEKLKEDYLTSLGGFGSEADIKSAAQQFADAWYEAFKETGDGLIGLEENFDELLDNILKKQIMLKATDAFLKPLFEQINAIFSSADFGSYIESIINGTTSSFDGANITLEELQAVQDLADKVFPEMNEYLKDLMESLGVEWGTESKDTMSGLQKGIQGVTEETAQALEALLNSMRYFVSDSNLQLRNILTTLTAPAPENPYLLELKAQTEQLRLMNSLWSSLSKMSTGNGRVLKVQIV